MKRTVFSPHEGIQVYYVKSHEKWDMSVQHYHDAYEIYLHLSGKRYVFFDNICYTMERGDMYILKPFDIHYAQSFESDYYERYVINFKRDLLKPILTNEEIHLLLDERLKPCIIHLNEDETETMAKYFEFVNDCSEKQGFLADKLLKSSLIHLISKASEYTSQKTDFISKSAEPEIVSVIEYINNNYKNKISLDDVSSAVQMSKYHLCRKFKETTGATIFQYIDNVRLVRVHSLLLNTDLSLENITDETGFGTYARLSKAFKKIYGVTPKEFRKMQS